MILAIDFDETLMDTANVPAGKRMGQPTPQAVYATQRLARDGHQIVIFTARNVQEPSSYKAVEDWLKYFDIPYHGITNVKRPEFDLYIDNRNIHFKAWPLVLAEIDRMRDKTYHYDFIDEQYKLDT